MKKVLVVIALLAFLAAQGCGAPAPLSLKIDGPRTIGLRAGQKLELRLDSNPTTGYSWAMGYVGGESVLAKSSEPRYVVRSSLIGGGGYELFRFDAVKKGTAKLKFEYRRPWEKDVAPVRTYVVQVIVT